MRKLISRLCYLLAALPLCFVCAKAQGQIDHSTPIFNKSAAFTPSLQVTPDKYPDIDTGLSITSSTASYSRMVSLGWSVSRKRTAAISLEKMKVSSFSYKLEGGRSEKPDWYFRSIPITFSLSQDIGNPDWRITPVVGVGMSVYLSKTRSRIQNTDNAFERHLGAGFGGQATFGLRTKVTDNTFVFSQARYRMIDGLAFSAHETDYRFGLFDFAVGFGVDF
jgi:outer membrane protein W